MNFDFPDTVGVLEQPSTHHLRQVLYRSKGHSQGSVTRLVSPSDIGKRIKPFVFLDDFDLVPADRGMFGMHPHSGIATLTVILSGRMDYADTTGMSGTLETGGVEWMRAGGGVWHTGGPAEGDQVRGFQLWVALPPEDENGPAHSQYLAPGDVPSFGPARIILGRYGNASSAIETRASINYLHVKLKDGEHWRYQPPAGHTVGWVAPSSGTLHSAGAVLRNEIAVFEESEGALDFIAEGDTEFVLGSAVKHPHDLVLGYYSVHTNPAALKQGEARIQEIRQQLQLNR
ncbi:MAG: pirin family protein [Nitrospiraceae bacterium]